MSLTELFAPNFSSRSPLRQEIMKTIRRPEEICVKELAPAAQLKPEQESQVKDLAGNLTKKLRDVRNPGLVASLVQEFSLSSSEGLSLMCLAEALLRIPDEATRDALIEDKIGHGDWLGHAGKDKPLASNAASWALALTEQIVEKRSGKTAFDAFMGFVHRSTKPIIRAAVDRAMRLMGEQFVLGQTIEQATQNAKKLEDIGFTYSYDMLGEAALTHYDAEAYKQAYLNAIHVIGKRAQGKNVYERPGISIKLTGLHPRYSRSQYARAIEELLPIVQELALLARHYDIGINIDAEESERVDLSLDILERLCKTEGLKGWNGIGYVVQAYGKRSPYIIDYLIDLAKKNKQRLMIRLVKGAYWDTEIKNTQLNGLSDFPVFTRKSHTDICYIACARKMLDAREFVYPQFATHNARTLATIYTLAGPDYKVGSYEFQCLHGMGESLYKQVVGEDMLDRATRIYAPVGYHETLLAYLVRRLLENGANSSFVNQIEDRSISISSLIEDPVKVAQRYQPFGSPHTYIKNPLDLFEPVRRNSKGLDLDDSHVLEKLAKAMEKAPTHWEAKPSLKQEDGQTKDVLNPFNHHDVVGKVVYATNKTISQTVKKAEKAFAHWKKTSVNDRADILMKASDLLEEHHALFLSLISREAGRTLPNIVSEVREAVDFLRYYAQTIKQDFTNETHIPVGPVACISPWNFPLAIFIGQIAAALAAGNTVIAKPAEESPLVGAAAVKILHQAGIPEDVLSLLPGEGDVGAALVADEHIKAILFTGSTYVAKLINQQVQRRRTKSGQPVPFVAETGGQNAMIVDSSALAEQVVHDVVVSAFDSAGQRCSALRVLCIQDDCADHIVAMLHGAMDQLSLGNPQALSTDIGPVINDAAAKDINKHIQDFKRRGYDVYSVKIPSYCDQGSFVAPTAIEIPSLSDLKGEVFGPVLHVLRYKREELPQLVSQINSTGFGLTFGMHTRNDTSMNQILDQIDAGNLYINRNIVGAIVGCQPFGGHRYSGTGPKAGGPLIVRRLLDQKPPIKRIVHGRISSVMHLWMDYLRENGDSEAAQYAYNIAQKSMWKGTLLLPGPVGEKNTYNLTTRGNILCFAETKAGLFDQVSLALSGGNTALLLTSAQNLDWLESIPPQVARFIKPLTLHDRFPMITILLGERDTDQFRDLQDKLSHSDQPVIPAFITGDKTINQENVLAEQACSINTTAAGGNASLMALT